MNINTVKFVKASELHDGIDARFIDLLVNELLANEHTWGDSKHTLIEKYVDDPDAVADENEQDFGPTVRIWAERMKSLPKDVLIDLEA